VRRQRRGRGIASCGRPRKRVGGFASPSRSGTAAVNGVPAHFNSHPLAVAFAGRRMVRGRRQVCSSARHGRRTPVKSTPHRPDLPPQVVRRDLASCEGMRGVCAWFWHPGITFVLQSALLPCAAGEGTGEAGGGGGRPRCISGCVTGAESSLAPSTTLRVVPLPVALRQGRIADCELTQWRRPD
jgi:hypothetical protein